MGVRIGDKLVMREDLVIGKHYNNLTFLEEMVKYKGKVCTVRRIDSFGRIRIEECEYGFIYDTEMFSKNDLGLLIERIKKDLETASMLNQFQLGIALKVMEDRLWDINPAYAQQCNDIQHSILDD